MWGIARGQLISLAHQAWLINASLKEQRVRFHIWGWIRQPHRHCWASLLCVVWGQDVGWLLGKAFFRAGVVLLIMITPKVTSITMRSRKAKIMFTKY